MGVEFGIAFEVDISLHAGDGEQKADLRTHAYHARLERTESVARSAVAADLLVDVADGAELEFCVRNCDAAQSRCPSTPFW